jgi:predicted aconitase
MGSRSENRKKTKLIQVRATPDEKVALKAKAAAYGISMGELCRATIFGIKTKSKTDQDAILSLAQARADLGRVGGFLKATLAGEFPGSPAIPTAEIRDFLHKTQAAEKTVLAAVEKLVCAL